MNNNRPRHHPLGGAARGPSQPPNFAHQYPNPFLENPNLFHQNPNLFLPNSKFTSYSNYRSFSQNPAFSFPPHNYRPKSGELLQKVEQAVTKAQQDILAAGESVSSWKVSQSALLSLQIDSWSSLGFQLQDVPPLYRLMVTEGKVNAFIHCFVGARRITSIYDLDIAICKSEGVDHFEELGLGPLLCHPLIQHYFLVPLDLKEFCKITSDEIISSLVEFMDTKVKYVKAEEFLCFLAKSRSISSQEKLGVRIQSLGMHIGFIIEAKKAEKAILVNYLQTLKHSSGKQSKEQERDSSQPCGGTLPLKQGLDRRFNAISERIRLFSTSSRFRGKHIRFDSPSSGDENIDDDDTDSDEHDNNDSNIQYQNSLKNVMEAEQRVSSCPYPSAAEEKLRLGLKAEMDGNATPGCGKSDVGKKKSGKKRKSENQYRGVKDREDNEVSSDSQRMKKMQRCFKEKKQDLSERFNVVTSPQEQHLHYQSANDGSISTRKNKRQSGRDDQKYKLLELNTMESFITSWRDTCRKYSVAEIFSKMSKFYHPKRKRLPKFVRQKLGGAIINVAVTSIKWGMWDSLCDIGQPLGLNKLTGPSSVQPTEMIENGSVSKRDSALSKNQHACEAGFSVTVDDIFKEVAAFFDLEPIIPVLSEGKMHLQKQLLSLKVIHDCEKWLEKKFSVNNFSMLGHGDFVVFLHKNISVLPYKLCNILSVGDICGKSPLEVSMLQNQLLLLLAQAANHIQDDVVITNQRISSLLEKQFPFISFGIRRNGPEEDILGLIREQGNSKASSTVMFSTTLLGESRNGDALMQSGKYSSELKKVLSELGQGVGCLGSVSNKDAIECLLKAPMLSDLQSWSHWEYIYAPSLGPLLGWLLNQVHTKDLLCILTRDGKLIRIDPTVNVDSFLEASLQGSAYQTAVKLLSLLSVYRGTNRAPLSLLKRYAVHAIEVISRNSTENTKVKDNNKASTKHTMLDVDAKGTSLTLQSHEGFCTTNREVVVASRFVLDCLTFLPPEFRSYAADILLSGLRSLNKNAPAIILRECNQTDQLLMLHDIGMSLGILEWIEDYSVFNSATAGNLFTSNGTLKNLSDTSPSLIIKSTPDTLDKLLSPDDKVMASEAQTHLLDGNHKALAEKLQESEVPNDVPVEKSGEGSGSLVLKGSHEDEAVRVIESIRSEEFGLGPNLKVAESSLMKKQHARLGRALHCLSQELYSQDSHFLLELIQNADDNIYSEGVDPSLVFILQDTGITVLNNERGFSAQNIRALCDVGNSTKKGSGAGYIGQKGIGFKSVFQVTDAPEIHSNGFHVKFDISEDQIGFVLPTVISPCSINWFMCLLSPEIDQPDAACWNTCIVLPFRSKLKGDGLGSIVSMFSDLHPSLLLFLHRLRCIKFKNVLSDSLTIMRKETVGNGIVKVSYGEEVMSWLVASQKLQANVIRSDVQTTEISVAFTLQESNSGGYKPYLKQQPVFAFLPLRTYGMKFILQGDFVLPSSREEVDGDSAWNQWLLSEFPALFVRAEKSFYGLPCFQDSPGKAVTAYMSFVPLIGEVHGFFSHMPHMIISELRMSSCMLLDGSDIEWVPPCRVLRGWNEQARILLPERLLHKHLGLGYLNKDIILSDPLAKALGIQDYGPKILCAFITSICHTDNGINSFGLSWLCSWISALYTMLSVHSSGCQAAEMEGDIVQCLRKVPFIPLSDGSFGSLAEGPIWLPCDSTAVESKSTHNPKDFPNLYANLRTVNPALLSEATTNTYCLEEIHADTIIQMLCRVGVQQLSAHEVIKSHILRAMSEDISTRDKHLMTDYLSFLMLHLQSACPSCNIERAEIISELQRKPIVLTNHGYKCLSVEPVHFSRKFGNFVDIQQLIDDKNTQWHEIDSIYLRHPCVQSLSLGLKNWRDFLQELGVTDFVQIIKKKVADVSDTISQNMMSGGGDLLQSAIVVEDWESPELVDLLSTLTSDMCVGKCKYLLEILDKMWDDNFSAKVISYSVLKSTKEQKAFQSSFLKTIHNFSWIASSMDEVLHYPKDVFFDCEAVRSILGDIAPYAVPQVTNKALLNAIGFKTRVTLDDGLIILKQWRTLRVPFRTSIAQMSKFYTFVWDEITASKRNITEFTSESFIFFPLAVTSRREDVIAGEFLSPKEVFWHDPTGCIDRMKEVVLHSSTENVPSNTMLAHVYPTLYDFFVNDCGVPKVPPFRRYLQILLQFSSVALPSHAENTVYRVLLKWADDLMSGMVGNEEISYLKGCLQKLENTVLPTVQDKWVSLHPSFGLVCWSDDEELMKQFKHSKNIDFLHFGELSDEEKNTLSARFPALMKTIGVPSLSELVSREAIFYGMEDSTEKVSLLNWVLPYAQRYIYKMHPNRYAHLTESGCEGLSQLRVVVVEKLYYRLSIKGCENTSKKRIECSSLLQENTLYVTRASDSHTIFLELSRFFFNGSVELHFANFLHMIATMAESGSTEEQTEFFIVNSQKVPKLLDEENVWSISCLSLPNEDATSQPASSLPVTNENNPSKPKRKPDTGTNWPPTGWKTAPDFHFACRTKPLFTPNVGLQNGVPETEQVIHTEDWHVPIEITDDWTLDQSTAVVSQGSRTRKDEALLLGCAGTVGKVVNSSLEMLTELPDLGIVTDLGSGISTFTTRDQLLFSADENQAFRTGRLGELLAYKYFVEKLSPAAVRWVNEVTETGLPFDLVVRENEESKEFIEVKATKSIYKNWFTISTREWKFACERGDSFSVAHIVLADPKNAKITIFKNPVKLCQQDVLNLAILMSKQQKEASTPVTYGGKC